MHNLLQGSSSCNHRGLESNHHTIYQLRDNARFGIAIATSNTDCREFSLTLSLCNCCRNSLFVMDVLATTPEGAPSNVSPPPVYFSPLPNCVFFQNIWPILVAPLRTVTASDLQTIRYVDVLFHLRCVNTQWKWLVESSTEWAAYRLARIDSRGLVKRGTSAQFACRRALEEYNSALSLLKEPRRLTVAMCHHPLILPFPEICDRWLVVLKSILERARDATVITPNLNEAYMYIPPEVGVHMSSDMVALWNRYSNLHLGT